MRAVEYASAGVGAVLLEVRAQDGHQLRRARYGSCLTLRAVLQAACVVLLTAIGPGRPAPTWSRLADPKPLTGLKIRTSYRL
ncbi:hypothetical protein GCM10027187_51330 [Streptosporangium sandarakinum]